MTPATMTAIECDRERETGEDLGVDPTAHEPAKDVGMLPPARRSWRSPEFCPTIGGRRIARVSTRQLRLCLTQPAR